ncbi:MAG TPA: hypothetical protein VJ862_05460 [Rhodanobacteraceae bacterium]|nr:hypothetical protein [Rhodanobacteraceae bacterium]
MKALHISLIAGALAALAGTAMASSGSLVEFRPQVMPVVVQVNAEGRVTDILPSEQLPPGLSHLLVDQLNAWIVKPAVVKGHPVASRFIAEVGMRANPRKDGKFDASFVYVKGLPMPFGGAVHWNVINGGLELALVSDDSVVPREWHVRYTPASYPQSAVASSLARTATIRSGARSGPEPTAVSQSAVIPVMAQPAVSAAPSNFRTTGAPHTEIR